MRLGVLLSLSCVAAVAARADEPCVPVKPCEIQPQPGERSEPPADLGAEARALHDLLSCQGRLPEGIAPGPVKAYCARQATLAARAEKARDALRAALQPLRPARLPSAVVFPLSAPDLLRALAAYPDARNVTLTSGRACGDPRLVAGLRDPARLAAFLTAVADAGDDLLRAREGEPALRRLRPRAELGALPLLVWALAVDGHEPVSLKYVRVEPAGNLRYLGASELASPAAPGGPGPFDGCELAFVRRGDAPGTLPRLARNLRADLSDAGVAADPGPLAHLDAKGSFAAVLAEAGALSGDGASRLRELLLRRAVFAVSDGTGPTAEQVRQAGLVDERPGRGLRVIRKP